MTLKECSTVNYWMWLDVQEKHDEKKERAYLCVEFRYYDFENNRIYRGTFPASKFDEIDKAYHMISHGYIRIEDVPKLKSFPMYDDSKIETA